MDISQRGIDHIVSFEGKYTKLSDGRYEAYLDKLAKPHVWTLYCGLTKGVTEGMVRTVEECDRMFAKELAIYEDAVERLVTVPLNQNQFDALVSFVYNCGPEALRTSTLLKVLNKGEYEAVPAQMARYIKAGGKTYPGLIRRRRAEGALFLEPMPQALPEAREAPSMPQRVEVTPATSTAAIVKESWTVKGVLVAATATVGNFLSDAWGWGGSVVKEAATELTTVKTNLGPFDTILFSMKTILPAIAIAGLLIVVVRRVQAGKEGKIG